MLLPYQRRLKRGDFYTLEVFEPFFYVKLFICPYCIIYYATYSAECTDSPVTFGVLFVLFKHIDIKVQ